MKKLLILAITLTTFFFLAPAAMASPYEGIWVVVGQNVFLSLNEGQTDLYVIGEMDAVDGTWQAYMGELNLNIINAVTIFGYLNSTYRLTFQSEIAGTAVLLSCAPLAPGAVCDTPVGTSFNLQKIW